MKTELEALKTYQDITNRIHALQSEIRYAGFDGMELNINGKDCTVTLIERPSYRTINHRFWSSGRYKREVQTL